MIWRYLIVIAIIFNSCSEAEEHNNSNGQGEEAIVENNAIGEVGTFPDAEGENFEDWEMGDVGVDSSYMEEVIEESPLKWKSDSFNLELDSKLVSPWTFSHLYQIVLSEWPEAYEDLLDISFQKANDHVEPIKIAFLIPTAKLAKIDSVEIQSRFDRVCLKMKGVITGCEQYEIGEPKTYSWQAWEDKNVSKITFYFAFSC